MFSTSVGTGDLADVVQESPHPEPEERRLIQTNGAGNGARVVGNALAVAERVRVLGFDRPRPSADDRLEAVLEPAHPPADVGQVALRAEAAEEPVRDVERLQRLALASQRAVELRLIARNLGGEQQVLTARRIVERGAKKALRVVVLSELTSDDTEMLPCFGDGPLVVQSLRATEHAFAH